MLHARETQTRNPRVNLSSHGSPRHTSLPKNATHSITNPLAAENFPMPTKYTTAQIAELMEQISNWGRWGKDDQRGALNFITNEKRAAAAGLVKTGETVS